MFHFRVFMHSEPPLPDPIKLLRRIHALDNSARLLQQECGHMMQRRKNAVLEATKYLVHLRELCHTEVRIISCYFGRAYSTARRVRALTAGWSHVSRIM